jgi:hypothetical protein
MGYLAIGEAFRFTLASREDEGMHAVQVTRTVALWLTAIVLLGVFLAMGYGLIGLMLLFLGGGLIGGALMSYIGGD